MGVAIAACPVVRPRVAVNLAIKRNAGRREVGFIMALPDADLVMQREVKQNKDYLINFVLIVIHNFTR
jgi:hypothetical protein